MATLKPLSPFPDPNSTSIGGDRLSTLWARWFEQLRFALNTLISSWNGALSYYGAFHHDTTTQLTGAMTNVSTTPIQVTSTAGFPSSGTLAIEGEFISYTTKTATTFDGVITRGVYGSSNSAHAIGAFVSGAQGTAALTRTLVLLDITDISNGVTLDTTTSEITIANEGTYNLMYSIQFSNASSVIDEATIWFVIDGVDVPASASRVTLPTRHASTPGAIIVAMNLFYTFTAGQKVQLYWANNNGTAVIVTYPPSTAPVYPASPSVIFTVNSL